MQLKNNLGCFAAKLNAAALARLQPPLVDKLCNCHKIAEGCFSHVFTSLLYFFLSALYMRISVYWHITNICQYISQAQSGATSNSLLSISAEITCSETRIEISTLALHSTLLNHTLPDSEELHYSYTDELS